MTEINYTKALGVVSFTSQAPIDFMRGALPATRYILTPVQKEYLQTRRISLEKGLIVPKQVHGDRIWEVTAKDIPFSGVFEADAVVTAEPGLPIAIRTADCLPALMYDPVRRVIAAVHAGWKSTKLDIAQKTVQFLQAEHGVDPKDIRVAIGPCIHAQSCEVGPEFREYFPMDTVETPEGLRFDIVSANLRQLTSAGVSRANIFDSGACSFSDPVRFHSFRRDGEKSGRMLSVIMMEAI